MVILVVMVTEVQKYRASMFQIGGFGFMSPLGKVVLNFSEYELLDLHLQFLLNILISLLLFGLGIMLLIKGMETLEERK